MTREEAILKIGELVAYARTQGWDDDYTDAFKTLEQESCEDCVSRESILDAITEIDDNTNMDIYTNEVREIIRDLPSVIPTQKWISVSERLPKEDESVLLTICANSSLYGFNKNFVKVMCGSYSPCEDKRDWIVNEVRYYIDNVIAWMPLPESYRAEMESEDGN